MRKNVEIEIILKDYIREEKKRGESESERESIYFKYVTSVFILETHLIVNEFCHH